MAVVVSLALILSGCSLIEGSAGTTVTALWVSTESDEAGTAKVSVDVRRSPPGTGFKLDMSAEKSSGAGPQWLAASWAGTSFAVLAAGVNPGTVQVAFDVDGEIDGPSAGGLMAVTVLAELRGEEIKPQMAMTGTIGPGGYIGPVGHVPEKIRAASEKGIESVVIPVSKSVAVERGSRETVDVVEYGGDLGVEVIPVSNIVAAYAAMTGVQLISDMSAQAIAPSIEFLDAVAERTRLALERTRTLEGQLTARGSVPSGPETEIVSRSIKEAEADAATNTARAEAAISADNPITAYSEIFSAERLLSSANAVSEMFAIVSASGTEAAKNSLGAQLTEIASAQDAKLKEIADEHGNSSASFAANADALNWVTDSIALTDVSKARLEDLNDGSSGTSNTSSLDVETLASIADGIAEAGFYVIGPASDAIAFTRTLGGNPPVDTDMAILGDFLFDAGDALLNYFREVTLETMAKKAKTDKKTLEQELQASDLDLSFLLVTEDVNDYAQRVLPEQAGAVRLATASTYFVYANYVTAKYGTLDVRNEDGYAASIGKPEIFDELVTTSERASNATQHLLQAIGVDPSYIGFLTRWGRAMDSLGLVSMRAADRLDGLSLLWYGLIQSRVAQNLATRADEDSIDILDRQ